MGTVLSDELMWESICASFGRPQQGGTVPAAIAPENTLTSLYSTTGSIQLGGGPLGSLLSGIAPLNPSPLASAYLSIPIKPMPPALLPWSYVTRRFDSLIDSIGIREDEITDGMKKAMRVVGSLNRAYYGHSSQTDNARLLGSWAKQLRVRPFSDLDLMFKLPASEYHRFEKHAYNKQSSLLQDARKNLLVTYPRTEIWGDRHVVAVEVDGTLIEVVPAFELTSGQYWICDTNDDGRYKLADPAAEEYALQDANTRHNGNAQALTRLLKKWQIQNAVPIKAFQLERLAIEFLDGWQHSKNNRFYYDWMIRDFFLHVLSRANGLVQMPGTGEWIALGSEWLGAARTAYLNAYAACSYEQTNHEATAGREWQKIFGAAAPLTVS